MITDHDFEQRLTELDFLSACAETMDAFNGEYERLLSLIKNHPGPRLELALKLKALQIKQGFFLCTLYEIERLRDQSNEQSG
jgi:hypothetical protein